MLIFFIRDQDHKFNLLNDKFGIGIGLTKTGFTHNSTTSARSTPSNVRRPRFGIGIRFTKTGGTPTVCTMATPGTPTST